jgi:hypothetical protein
LALFTGLPRREFLGNSAAGLETFVLGTGAKLTLAGVAQAFYEACSALSVKV